MKFYLLCVITCVVFSNVYSLKRKVQTTYWPDCNNYKASCEIAKAFGNNIVYTKASTKEHDDLHFVFSTFNIPAVVLARTTGVDTELSFQWDMLMSGLMENAITPKNKDAKLEYLYGIAFTKLIEYNDTHDSADLTSKDLRKDAFLIRNFTDFFWDPLAEKSDGKNKFVFNSSSDFMPPSKSNNGTLTFSFQVSEADGRASQLPALKYTANETLFEFALDNYTPSFKKSRFALEAVMVSLSKNKEMKIETTHSIDDEYSPGVFQITNWLPDPAKKKVSGYFQWKPVCYFSSSRGTNTASKVKHYDIVDVHDSKEQQATIEQSIIVSLFGNVWDNKDVIVRASNISFGLTKDGFYVLNNYTAWSAAIGYGEPPQDTISTMVVIIISAGLGIPVALIIFGGIFTFIRRKRNSSGYQPISSGPINQNSPQ